MTPLPGSAPAARLSPLAVVAFVFVFVFPPVAILLGCMAQSAMRPTPGRGRGLAKAAVLLGSVFTALTALSLLVSFGLIGASLHVG
ncbi:DUF4190 domain-containing protein [Leifsonia sp. NPDC080035]|uniref:DUF4190 domain-containing protein n=1 Tax=Leifsonia sp. NPDC080035 TaxID=3143936 RepID=A0AAU7GEK4_9MICO